MTTTENQLITKTALKARGWTESLITRFFPAPTEERTNHRYRSAPPIKLYDLTKVAEIEARPDFQSAKSVASTRSQKAQVTASRRRDETRNWVEQLPPPNIPQHTPEKLRKLAVSHYNALWSSRGKHDKYAMGDEPDDFLRRISVNFLRHELSPYEFRLLQSFGRIGAAEARIAIRQQILDAIATAYPDLADECKQQSNRNA